MLYVAPVFQVYKDCYLLHIYLGSLVNARFFWPHWAVHAVLAKTVETKTLTPW